MGKQVDTQLLVQGLIIAAKTSLESALKNELCTFPIALFETPVLHKTKRSILVDSIRTSAKKK